MSAQWFILQNYGVTFGVQAKKEGVTAAYKPAGWDQIPEGLKDPEGHWFTIHSGTLGTPSMEEKYGFLDLIGARLTIRSAPRDGSGFRRTAAAALVH